MTGKSTRQHERHVRFDSLDDMPAAEPLRADFRALDDADVERRAAEDPDAGLVPPGFWNEARVVTAEPKHQITLRLDADVLRYFRASGKGYQSRIDAVLKSYVRAQDRAR